jgi:GAF domain-containing protein
LNDPSKFSVLRSALAVPLEGAGSVVAVLAVYRAGADAFSREELNILQAMALKAGFIIEKALQDSSEGSVKVVASAAGAGGD